MEMKEPTCASTATRQKAARQARVVRKIESRRPGFRGRQVLGDVANLANI